jgi:hypothetical protein
MTAATASSPHLEWSRARAEARITHGGTKPAVAVWSPFHGCEVFITPRENMLLMWLGLGKRVTLRSIPSVLGYTMGGFRKAVQTLNKLGLLGHDARRGRHGYTRLWGNVRRQSSGGRSFVSRFLLPKGQGAHITAERVVEPPKPRLGRLVVDESGRWSAA